VTADHFYTHLKRRQFKKTLALFNNRMFHFKLLNVYLFIHVFVVTNTVEIYYIGGSKMNRKCNPQNIRHIWGLALNHMTWKSNLHF